MVCTQPVGRAIKAIWRPEGVEVRSFHLNCNKWACEACARRKAVILANRVREGFKGERIRFATFTDSGRGSFAERLKRLKTAWNRLRLDLSRKHGLTKFFWVLEFGHEHGRPHLHCLLNCYVPQRELGRLAQNAGFGRIVDIREVKTGGGFGYVFKYLHKDCGSVAGAATLRAIGGRRFGTSRNIKPLTHDAVSSCLLAYSNELPPAGMMKIEAELFAKQFGPNTFTLHWDSHSAASMCKTANPLYKSPDEWRATLPEHSSWQQIAARTCGCIDRAMLRWGPNSARALLMGKCTMLLGGAAYGGNVLGPGGSTASQAVARPS